MDYRFFEPESRVKADECNDFDSLLEEFDDGKHFAITTYQVFKRLKSRTMNKGRLYVAQDLSDKGFDNIGIRSGKYNKESPEFRAVPLLFDREMEVESISRHPMYFFKRIGFQEQPILDPFQLYDQKGKYLLLMRMGRRRTDIYKCVCVIENIDPAG